MQSAAQIRSAFLKFFEEREHRIVPSAPVFPQDDPTLLFTNAGMNQFKDVFLGTGTRDYRRAADTQKCIRVSGKHNDLEEVGRDTYHHTFFEMLGNWSFGDYFKQEAITWAWEFLTGTLGLPKDRLWVTVFEGDPGAGIEPDEEAARIWAEATDIDPARVLRFGAKDNFWEMGETGPCGPCTEIHIDRGAAGADPADGSNREIGVNAGNERFIELWNLVFIQYNRQADGSLVPLPAQHVDTGMGFERIVSVVQGRSSNYDTDVFTPIFDAIAAATGKTYGGTAEDADVAFRVVADHVRAISVAVADGALPSNDGRGYVLRRLLRRAARFGRQALGMERPFIHRLVPAVAASLGDAFPEIPARQKHITLVIEAEEKAFALTLDKGIDLFEGLAERVRKGGAREIPGGEAYDLYATYGFPRDLVDLMAGEQGLSVDAGGWAEAEAAHRAASRGDGGGKYLVDPGAIEGLPPTETFFHAEGGSNGLASPARPLRLIDGRVLVLDRTPFYAESGGQVGDTGEIVGGDFRFRVDDTQKMGSIVLHVGKLRGGDARDLPELVEARVNEERRLDIMANHTGTHLLHWALRDVLGEGANQQGSLVAPDRLRFDITHSRAIAPEELERIEDLVNQRIRGDTPLRTTLENLDEAKARGVTALFGEKYDESVRVVDIGGYSTELCGGTHCRATGQIGAFAIISESAVQAGVRRIEAVTRGAAIRRMQEQRRLLREASRALKTAESDLVTRIKALQDQVKDLKKGGARQAASDVTSSAKDLLAEAQEIGGVKVLCRRVADIGAQDLSLLCDNLKSLGAPICGLLALESEGKALLAAFASKDIAGRRVKAGDVVREVAPIVGGGGGGRPDFAQAGGKDPSRIDEALARAGELFAERLAP